MKRCWKMLLVAVFAVGSVTQAQDRPPGGPGSGPPGSGPGGPPMFGPPGGSGGFLGMLNIPEVQSELKLSDEQKQSITRVIDEMQQGIRQIFEGNAENGPADGPPPFAEIRQKIDKLTANAEETITSTLGDEQRKRFSELKIQQAGSRALLSSDVSKSLEFSDEQLGKLRELMAGNNPFLSPEDQADIEKNAMAVLSADQQSKFKELKGTAFPFPLSGIGFPGKGGPGGFGPPGMGGPGGMMGQERKLVDQFDKDGNGWLNKEERIAARQSLQSNGGGGGRGRGFGPPGGGGREEPVSAGETIDPASITASEAPLYDSHTVRTIFLNFDGNDWESDLEAFNNTDVEIPATLTADGRTYENVGVHFRGMSSFGMVQAGHKRSLNLSMDFLNEDQNLQGYKTLNLLNAHEDPTFLHTVLYFDVARNYIPVPKANFVRVVINGENWGLYVSAQQFNKEFIKENFQSTKGTRWKVQGSPMGRGGLEYLGDDIAAYERIYTMKTDDGEGAWKKLIALCKTLNETPTSELEAALAPMLDIDGALWFLALENVLINSDGYWVRASDYCIFLDADGKFHVIPHDANETFQPGMGPEMGRGPGGPGGGFGGPGGGGFGGGRGQRPPGEGELRLENRRPDGEGQNGRPPEGNPGAAGQGEQGRREGGRGGRGPGGMGGGNGVTLDPLVGLDDTSKPLRSKLLAVPELRQRYLSYVKTIAEDWLDWKTLGPVVDDYARVISPYIEADTRKLSSYAAFQAAVSSEVTATVARPAEPAVGPGGGPFGRGSRMSLRQFADQRRTFLLNHADVKPALRVDYKRPTGTKELK